MPTANSKTVLSTDEAARIIEVSAKSGVSELKFRGLHVTFGRPAERGSQATDSVQPEAPQVSQPVTALTEQEHQAQGQAALEQEEVRTREAELALLLITDPLKYEQMLASGQELSDDDVDTADEDDGND